MGFIQSGQKTLWLVLMLALAVSGCSAGSDVEQAVLASAVRNGDVTAELRATWTGQATSFDQRGDEAYAVGYFIENGALRGENSLFADAGSDVSMLDLEMQAEGPGYSAVIAHGEVTDLVLTGSILSTDDSDGSMVSDFSGLGATIIASRGARVTLDRIDITTDGFMRSAAISDDRANVLVRDSNIVTMGADPLTEAFDGYVNGANMALMIAPPWVLGIQGGVRAFNMLGDQSTLSVIDSSVASGGWALLSVDAGSESQMNIVDSELRMLPAAEGGMSSGEFAFSDRYGSGYGTYAIGGAKQNFYGAAISGTTFAGIFTGGEASYQSSDGTIALLDGSGEVFETVQGVGRPTVIDSVFGFMSHGDASVDILDGTQVNSQRATFLYKSGAVTINIDSAELNPGNGIILQMMDNDDRIVGGTMMAFNTEFSEDAGWPSENGNVSPPGGSPDMAMPPGPPPGDPGGPPGGPGPMGPRLPNGVELTLADGSYTGNLFNGTGYFGLPPVPLTVTITDGAELSGAISLTETRHVDETGAQNTHFTINEYYYLGHVENRNYRNGNSTLSVTIDNGGTWVVTGESYLSSLTVGDGRIEGPDGQSVSMLANGQSMSIEQGVYEGEIIISIE